MPSRNEADVDDIPEDVRNDLQLVFVSGIAEVIDAALEVLVANPPPSPLVVDSDTRCANPNPSHSQSKAKTDRITGFTDKHVFCNPVMPVYSVILSTYGSASILKKNLNEPVCCTPSRNCRLMLAPGAKGVASVIVPADSVLL